MEKTAGSMRHPWLTPTGHQPAWWISLRRTGGLPTPRQTWRVERGGVGAPRRAARQPQSSDDPGRVAHLGRRSPRLLRLTAGDRRQRGSGRMSP